MQLDRNDIENALRRKGFVQENSDHRFYYLFYNGKRTSIRTKISHGSDYKVYGDALLAHMVRQLHFDSKQHLVSFVECRTSETDYVQMLLGKQLL